MDTEFDYRDHIARQPVVVGPFTVTPYPVHHPIEAYGLRVEADGVTLAYTGDTDECDILSPCCTGPTWSSPTPRSSRGATTIPGIHLNGAQGAQVATRAGGVGRLMLTHIPPRGTTGSSAVRRRRPLGR